mmetsp:Transcript_54076/g.130369  ORF Transcript_54076/g.130369 Transcript_54076/m.130369 type:complete len:301 (-) Transcript_54076:48-950(-)
MHREDAHLPVAVLRSGHREPLGRERARGFRARCPKGELANRATERKTELRQQARGSSSEAAEDAEERACKGEGVEAEAHHAVIRHRPERHVRHLVGDHYAELRAAALTGGGTKADRVTHSLSLHVTVAQVDLRELDAQDLLDSVARQGRLAIRADGLCPGRSLQRVAAALQAGGVMALRRRQHHVPGGGVEEHREDLRLGLAHGDTADVEAGVRREAGQACRSRGHPLQLHHDARARGGRAASSSLCPLREGARCRAAPERPEQGLGRGELEEDGQRPDVAAELGDRHQSQSVRFQTAVS